MIIKGIVFIIIELLIGFVDIILINYIDVMKFVKSILVKVFLVWFLFSFFLILVIFFSIFNFINIFKFFGVNGFLEM